MSAIFSLPCEKQAAGMSSGACVFWYSAFTTVPYQGYEEGVFEAERRGDGEDGVEAAQQSSKQDEFAYVRLHGETGQVETQRR